MHRMIAFAQVCLLGIVLSFGWLPTNAASAGNGIQSPADGATVRGAVVVSGIAQDEQFAKWQLDLLPANQTDQVVFLSLSEQPLPTTGDLAVLDTTHFPDGDYKLRLRVVRRDGNYDEYYRDIVIANHVSPAATLQQPAASPVVRQPAVTRATQLGLPTHSPSGAPILYLTFDDGPNPVLTPQIVALLDRYDAKATFFVIGVHLNRSPAALQPVAENGHTIANHTWNHSSLVGLGPEGIASQLNRTADLVKETVGELLPAGSRMRYLRPPYGAVDDALINQAEDLGYQIVTWDIDPKDWQRPGAAAISSAVINRAFPGAIVVMHDGGGGSQQTVTALETILEALSKQGYVFHALP
ncbi:MAG: polysaccharide deacetylase family protein [Anaerolineae bacterium]|nr:polysaccharide deacetylase family protein [Anaerolineae bacterium]